MLDFIYLQQQLIEKKKDENHHCCLGCPLTADVDEFKFTHT